MERTAEALAPEGLGREAVELLQTGRITFPLPYAAHIRRIKAGALAYEAVAGEIEQLLDAVRAAAASSPLLEAPDQDFIDDLVARAYCGKVLEAG